MFVHYLDHEDKAPQRRDGVLSLGRVQVVSGRADRYRSHVLGQGSFHSLVYLIAGRFCRISLGLAIAAAFLFAGAADLMGQVEDSEEAPQMVYPSSSSEIEETEGNSELYQDLMPESGSGVGMVVTILGYLIIIGGMCVAAWYLFKRGVIRKPFSSSDGKLKVSESRMLGNRQYIMVVEYEDKKILLGVGPGKIDYLTSLDGYKSDFPKIEPEMEHASVRELA